MIDTISVTFNKKTNNFNIPFAIIAPKKKKKDLKDKYSAFPNGNYSNVIGVQQALINQDNILNFKKELDEFADFSYEKIKRERYEKQEYFEAEPEKEDDIKRKAGDEDDKSSSKDKQTTKFINKYKNLYIKSITKNLTNTSEVMPEGLYDKGLMVELSYAIQHAQTNEHIKEANEDFMAQLKNQNLEFYPNLSNRNSAVIL
jgi:hypothetical protein